ncbi:MAG TPA: OmpA family protein [Sphingobacteriaceae bacterium]
MSYKKVISASVVCLFLYFLPQNIFSDDIKRANRYYEKYDYKYAIEIYEKIMLRKPSPEVAQKLANCYRFINNTEAAERAYARVLNFPGFDPVNYRYYADALKQNGKFEQAKQNYLLYAQQASAKAELANMLANSADVARMWFENPDPSVRIDNELAFNTEYAEFSPVPFDDGYVFVSDRWFTQAKGKGNERDVYGWTGNPFLKLYTAVPANARAPRITVFPQPVNNEYHNGPAVFSASSDTVYFTRAGLVQKKKRKETTSNKKSIYFSVRSQGKWSEPQRIPFNTPENFSVQHPALSPDGSILYFASDMPGGSGGMDLYASRKQPNGTWGTPVNCGTHINSGEDDVFPSVRKDGRFYFSSKGHVGMGGLDIFTANGAYNDFTIAENLKSPLNSSKDDFGIMFFNEHSGFLSSNRRGGRGLDDIYRFTVTPPPVRTDEEKPDASRVFYAVEGQVVDRTSGAPIPGVSIFLINKDTGEEKVTISNEQGRFRFDLAPGTDYVVRGDIEKYFSRQEGQISTKGLSESTLFSVKFELEQSQDAYLVRLNNIYYNFDKWNIRPDAVPELNKVVNFMSSMPNVNIELRAHTDSRGPAIYNLWLSQKRAQSAVSYLKSNGVEGTRLTAVGLGETELINHCRDGVRCTAQQHQMNRRTEFKVVKVNPVMSLVSAPMANVR